MKGKHYTGKSLKNIQKTRKRGKDHPFYGKHRDPETRRKIGQSQIGKKNSPEARKKIGDANRGKIVTEESRKKQSDSTVGKYRGIDGKTSECIKIIYPDGSVKAFGSLREMNRSTGISRSVKRYVVKHGGVYKNKKGYIFELISKDEAKSLGCVNDARKYGIPKALR